MPCRILSVALLLIALISTSAQSQELFSHGRFAEVRLFRPATQAKSVALLLSGRDGWTPLMTALGQQLASQGALVAGIDVPKFFRELEDDGASCVFADGDLENLSHYVQGYAKLATYHSPLLVGYGNGATLAYAMIAQAPAGTFSGAVSLGFCPALDLKKPLCTGEGLGSHRSGATKVIQVVPSSTHGTPWVVLRGESDRACPAAAIDAFTQRAGHAQLASLHGVSDDYATTHAKWLPELSGAYQRLAADHAKSLPPPPPSLGDLPLIEVPAKGPSTRTLAVLLSGDGGWAGIDRSVAAALAARGVPVVGFDSLRYFWSSRTPQGLAGDLDRLVRYYLSHWDKDKVLLIGYSQGADVLPFALNRLPPQTRARVARSVLIGLGDNASFEFHIGNWLSGDDDGLPILPETARLDPANTLCLYGEEDDDSLCPRIPAGRVSAEVLPGGHHFNGAYDLLAQRILAHLPLK